VAASITTQLKGMAGLDTASSSAAPTAPPSRSSTATLICLAYLAGVHAEDRNMSRIKTKRVLNTTTPPPRTLKTSLRAFVCSAAHRDSVGMSADAIGAAFRPMK